MSIERAGTTILTFPTNMINGGVNISVSRYKDQRLDSPVNYLQAMERYFLNNPSENVVIGELEELVNLEGKVTGYEALARVRSEQGLQYPGELFLNNGSSGASLRRQISQFMALRALTCSKKGPTIWSNIEPEDLPYTYIPPGSHVEITENGILSDEDCRILQSLRQKRGVSIHLDDCAETEARTVKLLGKLQKEYDGIKIDVTRCDVKTAEQMIVQAGNYDDKTVVLERWADNPPLAHWFILLLPDEKAERNIRLQVRTKPEIALYI